MRNLFWTSEKLHNLKGYFFGKTYGESSKHLKEFLLRLIFKTSFASAEIYTFRFLFRYLNMINIHSPFHRFVGTLKLKYLNMMLMNRVEVDMIR